MFEVMGWFNANAGTVQALATVVLVLITIHYAFQTQRQVGEMRRTREAESAPYVTASLETPHGDDTVSLVVRNHGRTAARDVRVQIDPPIANVFETDHVAPDFLRGPVPFLPPGREMRTELWSHSHAFDERKGLAQSYTARVAWADARSGKRYDETYPLDFSGFRNIAYSNPTSVKQYQVIKDLYYASRDIRDSIGKIARAVEGTEPPLAQVRRPPARLEPKLGVGTLLRRIIKGAASRRRP